MKTPLDYNAPHLNDLHPGVSTVDTSLPVFRDICMFLRHEAKSDVIPSWANIDYTAVVFICLSGEGRLLVQKGVCELSEGQGILILPMQPHIRFPFPGHKVEYLAIRFNLKNMDFLQELDSTRFYLDETARSFLNAFIDSYQKAEKTDSSVDKCACALFLMQMLNAVRLNTLDTLSTSNTPDRFKRACKSLLATGSECANVSETAYKLGVTPNYLRIYFKKICGATPSHVRAMNLRNRSEQLLLNSSLSIGEIAAELNFSSIYSFSRFFKRKSGLSPSQFRAKFSENNGLEGV